jgi:hypothetical protein
MLCNIKHDIFSGSNIPRRRLPMETLDGEVVNEEETKCVDASKRVKAL